MIKAQKIKNYSLIVLSTLTLVLFSIQSFATSYDDTKKELLAIQTRSISGIVMVAGIVLTIFIVLGIIIQGFKWMSDPDNVNVKKSMMTFFIGVIFGGFLILQAELVARFIASIISG